LSKEPKDQLVKARCTRSMKLAIQAAAASMPGDNDEESDVLRVALEEYLTRRGFLKRADRIAEETPTYKTVRKLDRAAKALNKLSSKKRQATKKAAA
jgi:hypothetical protein